MELWAIKVYIAGIRIFNLFFCCDLDFDPMTFIYKLDPYSRGYIRRANVNFLRQGFLKVIVQQIELELWVIEVYFAEIVILDVFSSCDLDLDLMTFI